MNRPSLKLRQNTAQHSVEYMTVIILIMAGIIIGGPYVIRSWNAQMKGWDDSVTDSLQDTIEESPSFPAQGCDRTPDQWISGGCNASLVDPCTGAIISCGPTEMLLYETYNPDGCQCNIMFPAPVTIRCTTDASCCTPWSPSVPNPATDCGVNASPPCADGEARQTRTCGSGPETRCAFDPGCVFNCTGIFGPNSPPKYGDLCTGDDTGLSADTNYTYVNPGAGNCTDGTKCEIQCSPTYISYGASCDCRPGWNMSGTPAICCPPNQTESGGVCVCGPGFMKACPDGSGGYIAGQCYQGICGSGQCEQ